MKHWYLLKALQAFINGIPEMECKTIGNCYPSGIHCISCTIYTAKNFINESVKFWEEDDRYTRTPS